MTPDGVTDADAFPFAQTSVPHSLALARIRNSLCGNTSTSVSFTSRARS